MTHRQTYTLPPQHAIVSSSSWRMSHQWAQKHDSRLKSGFN